MYMPPLVTLSLSAPEGWLKLAIEDLLTIFPYLTLYPQHWLWAKGPGDPICPSHPDLLFSLANNLII